MQQAIEDIVNKKHNCDFVETYPWAHINTMKAFGIDTTQLIELENSLSPETRYMSPSLVFNLLDVVKKNHKFFDTIRLATTGDVYAKNDNKMPPVFKLNGNINTNSDIQESKHLGLLLYKKDQSATWEKDLILELKEIIGTITTDYNLNEITWT
jgi:phenylalanyl-tRNA synthetase beta subunit